MPLALVMALATTAPTRAAEPTPPSPAGPAPTQPTPTTPVPAQPGQPAALDPEALLERAARCLRRGDLPCAESESTQLLILPDVAPDVAREAAAIAVAALARQDKTQAAAAACLRLRSLWPGWSPPPDADPRIGAACAATTDAPRPPSDPVKPDAAKPDTAKPDTAKPDTAKPDAAKPPKPPKVKGPPRDPRFSLSLGAGLGVPLGRSSDRFDPGMHAALDFRWFPNTCWALWIQATLTLLPLTSGLPVEPGGGSGLTAFTAVLGVERRVPVATDLELSLAAGLGVGGFGVRGATDAVGLGLAASAGVRWLADRNLALRADFAPVAVLPFSDGVGLGGHLAFIVRGEASF